MSQEKMLRLIMWLRLIQVAGYSVSLIMFPKASFIPHENTKMIIVLVSLILFVIGVYSIYTNKKKLELAVLNLIGGVWFMLAYLAFIEFLFPTTFVLISIGMLNVFLSIMFGNANRKE